MPGGGRRWKTLVSRYGQSQLDIEFPTVVHRPWKSPTARFPHSHSTDDCFLSFVIRTARALRALAPTSMKGGYQRTRRGLPSGSSRIGMELRFQAHLALESNLDFRLISGLENAYRTKRVSRRCLMPRFFPNSGCRSDRRRQHASKAEGRRSRQPEQRRPPKPRLPRLRESSSIGKEAYPLLPAAR